MPLAATPDPRRRPPGIRSRATPEAPPGEPSRLVTELRARVDEVLRPIVARAARVVLLDFPAHPNAGDSAIWCGTLAYLRHAGVPVCHRCAADDYDRRQVAARLGDSGMILFSGGGNLGDFWETPQRFRERVVRDFPATPTVLLPQTMHFERDDARARAADAFGSHGDVTALLRDARSLRRARKHFPVATHLCPDTAFWLDALPRPRAPLQPLLWLWRTDKEASGAVPPPGATTADWLTDRASAALAIERWLRRQVTNRPRARAALHPALTRAADRVAGERLARACALLATARRVVTNRLHGHILCTMLGIPHVVLDNSYGKVRSFWDTWTHTSQVARWADSVEAVDDRLAELAR